MPRRLSWGSFHAFGGGGEFGRFCSKSARFKNLRLRQNDDQLGLEKLLIVIHMNNCDSLYAASSVGGVEYGHLVAIGCEFAPVPSKKVALLWRNFMTLKALPDR